VLRGPVVVVSAESQGTGLCKKQIASEIKRLSSIFISVFNSREGALQQNNAKVVKIIKKRSKTILGCQLLVSIGTIINAVTRNNEKGRKKFKHDKKMSID
jgi:hypothetical protein